MTTRPAHRARTALAVFVTIASCVLTGAANPSDARTRPRPPALQITGTGSWTSRVYDDVLVQGTADLDRRGRRTIEVPVAGVIDPDVGSFPSPGECKGATGWISVHDTRRADMTLIGNGEVCGHDVQDPESIVIYSFTGTFEVLEGPRCLQGIDGFFEMRLGANGTASLLAIDS